MIKIINYLFQSLLIYSFFILGRVLGLKISRKLFSFLFTLIGPIFKSKKIVEKNMIIFLKKLPLKNKNEIINNMWKNYGKTFIEYIFLNYFRKQKSHIFIKGEENLFQIKKQNKPVIFISGHFANFELMSMEITKKNIDLATIYRPLNNFFLNPLMEFIRRRYVCPNQIKKGINGVRDTVKFIKKKYSIALMIDQRVSEGEKIDFFGNLALTTTLPAKLSYKFGLDIIPVYIEREDNDNFTIEFQKRISSKDYKNKLELTLKLNKILEEMIKKNPGQWIWTHNRWK
jgi:KDO2-lipid IV(A) lauroyltransferase